MTRPGQEALDRLLIQELRGAYARAIDQQDWEAATDIFTDDAVVEYRDGTLHGGQEVYEYWRENVDYEYSMHTMQMPQLEVTGDTATGQWYLFEYYIAADGTSGFVFGWYDDEYRRVDGEWKIAALDMDVVHDTGGYHV
ncbi:MAG: nuclear transport factor 2 family protein [Halovenus sp.]